MKEKMIATRQYREHLLNDPYRPTYHFAVPDDDGRPGDPNGAFFADGVYHLMYLYLNSETAGYHWGHVTSTDLLHWRHLPDALKVTDGGRGCYSGGAFVDDDQTAYLTFWKFPSADPNGDAGGISIACAKPPYEEWELIAPVSVEGSREFWGTMDVEVDGKIEHVGCADPSNIWKMNGYYYMQMGNLPVLNAYGRHENSDPHYQGDWTDLFRSVDLKTWTFVHRFYQNPHLDEDYPDKTQDDMCPSFLPLFDAKENGNKTDKWLQLFISHNRGCQYYVGELDGETFVPECHGRMSWKDNAYFAPEALIDDRNRHIYWTWLLDNPTEDFERFGWSGVFGLPRLVWWKDGILRTAPVDELERLQYNRQTPKPDQNDNIVVKNGEVFRLKAAFDMAKTDKAGFSVRVNEECGAHTDIYVDKTTGKLVFDATNASGEDGWKIREEAPFTLAEKERLTLDIFVDKSVIEVYANERQAICRRVFPANPKQAVGVKLIGGNLTALEVFDMAPTNPY